MCFARFVPNFSVNFRLLHLFWGYDKLNIMFIMFYNLKFHFFPSFKYALKLCHKISILSPLHEKRQHD